MWQRSAVSKVYNIIKYIMWSMACCKDFAENQTQAYAENELFDQAELIFIKDKGV